MNNVFVANCIPIGDGRHQINLRLECEKKYVSENEYIKIIPCGKSPTPFFLVLIEIKGSDLDEMAKIAKEILDKIPDLQKKEEAIAQISTSRNLGGRKKQIN